MVGAITAVFVCAVPMSAVVADDQNAQNYEIANDNERLLLSGYSGGQVLRNVSLTSRVAVEFCVISSAILSNLWFPIFMAKLQPS